MVSGAPGGWDQMLHSPSLEEGQQPGKGQLVKGPQDGLGA